jgi:hypothetical protein
MTNNPPDNTPSFEPGKKVAFLPFHAINDFMRDDYRLQVIRETLQALPELPAEYRSAVERLTQKVVVVPGFRNSMKAPSGLRVRPTVDAFQKSPQLVAAILSAWGEAHPELRAQVHDLLEERGWTVLPSEADRTKLPGFITKWPNGEDFEVLNKAYQEKYPLAQTKSDDVSLMIVWVSTRLPYDVPGEEDDEVEE